ncbi:MAG TPA: hypothetical protein PKD37_06745 [Oligoflexia bacterium]|nr:hypothetical protein [Oligoflexia bacterium]HMP27660.1 hypothetical protein [Oligoflexia bacterium]
MTKLNRYALFFSILLLLIVLPACGRQFAQTASVGNQFQPIEPFTIKVKEEFNDGEKLRVIGELLAQGKISLAEQTKLLLSTGRGKEQEAVDGVLRIVTFKDGKQIGVALLQIPNLIKELGSTSLSKGQAVPFSISVAGRNMSDYQIELLWGEDARAYVGTALASWGAKQHIESLSNIKIADWRVQPPALGRTKYIISFKLLNVSNQMIQNISLGIGFRASAIDSDKFTGIGEEQEINLTNLGMTPRMGRDIKLAVTAPDVPIPDGYVLGPSIRVLRYE